MASEDAYRGARWTAILAILVLAITGFLFGWFEVCTEETTRVANAETVVETCGPPGVADGAVLSVALLILLLMLPDMTEIGVLGLSMKRRLETTEEIATNSAEKADKLEDRLTLQATRIDGLSSSLAAASSKASIGDIFIGDAALERARSGLDEKAEAYRRGRSADEPVTDATPQTTSPELATELIRQWETIAASLDLPPYRPGGRIDVERLPMSAETANRFRDVFRDELSVVRAARNTVAHAGVIAPDELRAASEIASKLLKIMRQRPPTPG